MDANTPLIQTVDLARVYRAGNSVVHALRGVSLTIEQGEFVAIMGRSGSGKSTLMHLLGCLDRPSAGRYFLGGEDVADISPDARARVRNSSIGFVFQSFNLLARNTALENAELPLIYAGVPRAERRRRAREALAQVGLGDRGGHKPSQLSGGEQQRVAIARALVNDPLLILADEPTGALDSQTGQEVIAVFKRLNRDGRTIVLVTHDPEIGDHAGRVIPMRDGRIACDEPIHAPLDAAGAIA